MSAWPIEVVVDWWKTDESFQGRKRNWWKMSDKEQGKGSLDADSMQNTVR